LREEEDSDVIKYLVYQFRLLLLLLLLFFFFFVFCFFPLLILGGATFVLFCTLRGEETDSDSYCSGLMLGV
jgi:hypothetical protein